MNRIVLVGRLENTPEIRYTSSGIPVSNFSLSVRRSHPNSEGIWERDVFRIVTWRKLAETCCKYLERGRWIAVDGKLQNRFINSQNNERRVMVEVHADDIRFLDFRPQQRNREVDRQSRDYRSQDQDSSEPDDDLKEEATNDSYEKETSESDAYKTFLEDEEGTPLDISDG